MSRVGLYTWPDGTRYEGEWREHTRDGFGVHTYADGTRYEVRFSRHRLLWQDSEHSMCSTCQGEFQKGLMHGATDQASLLPYATFWKRVWAFVRIWHFYLAS